MHLKVSYILERVSKNNAELSDQKVKLWSVYWDKKVGLKSELVKEGHCGKNGYSASVYNIHFIGK